ncbi:unnamed protein product [Rhizoctonia solani]|uniref:Uncharacterized protein n=1 Tax=Rhizoctonia solani TaxID=456999 RepID=A0A8H2WFK0_9AGAM|nr:unnamed protein product [Rhizoctonia solani]
MHTSANNSALISAYSTLPSHIFFAMSVSSTHSMPTTIQSSEMASLKGPRCAYRRVLEKLRTGLTSLKLKTKKKISTGGKLAPVAADTPTEKFGRPTRAVVLLDKYYGWEHAAKTSAEYMIKLFDCPSTLPGINPDEEYPELAEFIAYALFICQFKSQVNDYAMCLLWRLKAEYPQFKPAYGHGMYLPALTLAAKTAGHEDLSPECWAMAGQWILSTSQI